MYYVVYLGNLGNGVFSLVSGVSVDWQKSAGFLQRQGPGLRFLSTAIRGLVIIMTMIWACKPFATVLWIKC